MASFVHGWAEEDVEAMVISMYGSVVYIYCIVTFLKLCTAEEMQYALKRLCFASCYLALPCALLAHK